MHLTSQYFEHLKSIITKNTYQTNQNVPKSIYEP